MNKNSIELFDELVSNLKLKKNFTPIEKVDKIFNKVLKNRSLTEELIKLQTFENFYTFCKKIDQSLTRKELQKDLVKSISEFNLKFSKSGKFKLSEENLDKIAGGKINVFSKTIAALMALTIGVAPSLGKNAAFAADENKNISSVSEKKGISEKSVKDGAEISLSNVKNVVQDIKSTAVGVGTTVGVVVGLVKLCQYLTDDSGVPVEVERDFIKQEIKICEEEHYKQIDDPDAQKINSKHMPDILDIAILCNLFKDANDPQYMVSEFT